MQNDLMGLEVRRLKEQLSVKADVVWSLENRKQQLILRYVRAYVSNAMLSPSLCSFLSLSIFLIFSLSSILHISFLSILLSISFLSKLYFHDYLCFIYHLSLSFIHSSLLIADSYYLLLH